jgi:beta-N-acetylhexosaminidase
MVHRVAEARRRLAGRCAPRSVAVPCLVAVAVAVAALAVPVAGTSRDSRAAPTLAQMVGQKLVVSMSGSVPSVSLLARARHGEIGGVLIHRFNFRSAAQLRSIVWALQQAAAAGAQPRLLIAVDQEGGSVKTIPWIAPTLSPPELGRRGSAAVARAEGRRTGTALRGLGVHTDLAPVVDVPASSASAVYRQGRTWSFDADTTSRLAGAFALGLADGHALATSKHFPGLGFATRNTDEALVRIAAPRSRLAAGLLPYRRAIAAGTPLVMLSNAIYDAYDRQNAAGWSRAISTKLLRRDLGFEGVTMTDSLDGAAHVRHIAPNGLAIGAANAGTDIVLLTGGEAATRDVYTSMLRAAQSGRIARTAVAASYRRIRALKARL